MPSTTSRTKPKPGQIHDFATSRIEKAALELAGIRAQIKALEATKDDLNKRILLMVRNEGEAGEDGKVRYETERNKFVIIGGTKRTVDEGKMKVALMGAGLTPKQIGKVTLACVKKTEYEYAGVYPKKAEEALKEEAS